jgi:hypothetical protein
MVSCDAPIEIDHSKEAAGAGYPARTDHLGVGPCPPATPSIDVQRHRVMVG